MDPFRAGQYICKKRREKNLTQAQLAEQLGVSNKTISKWENGKCMPDYSIIEHLCKTLGITIAELMDGDDSDQNGVRIYDEEQILDLIRRVQELERQKQVMYGILLFAMGAAMLSLSHLFGGSAVKDFISGLLLGISVGGMLAGVYCIGRSFSKS